MWGNDSGLDQDSSSVDVKEWLGSGYILKVGLDMECQGENKSKKMMPSIFGLNWNSGIAIS